MDETDNLIEEPKEVHLCDTYTRRWFSRVLLLTFISTVLCIMIGQIWSYYFGLVNEMDKLTDATPQLFAMIESYNKEIRQNWNINNCTIDSDLISCNLDNWDGTMPFVLTHNITLTNWTLAQNYIHFEGQTTDYFNIMMYTQPW